MNIFPRYQNKEIKATKEASEEMWGFKKDLWDILQILKKGYICSASKRKGNVLEKCIRTGKIIFKAVVVDCGGYWLVIHFGKFGYKKHKRC